MTWSSGTATGCSGPCLSSNWPSLWPCSSRASGRDREPDRNGSSTETCPPVLSIKTPHHPPPLRVPPAASCVWRREGTPPAPPVATSSAGSASQSGVTPRLSAPCVGRNSSLTDLYT